MVLGQQFGDLDGVGRRPFSQVVADAPEREAVRVGEVFPDAADEDKVAAGAGAGCTWRPASPRALIGLSA